MLFYLLDILIYNLSGPDILKTKMAPVFSIIKNKFNFLTFFAPNQLNLAKNGNLEKQCFTQIIVFIVANICQTNQVNPINGSHDIFYKDIRKSNFFKTRVNRYIERNI